MNLLKRIAAVGIVGAGFAMVAAPEAEAQRFYLGIGTGGYYGSNYGWGGGHYGHGGRVWHDTGHYDYYPGGFYRHGNHYHYQPGHYHYHDTGHWDYYGGHHHGHGHHW